jgi:3-hydroxyisobutyrate dehydrogenase
MAVVGFIGLGNMGLPMAQNLMRAGHRLRAFDVVPACLEAVVGVGAQKAGSVAEAASGAELVVTMLPEGRHVREVYLGAEGVIAHSDPAALLIDCSTIDVLTARAVNQAASELGLEVLDAPVSGGVAGAENATLTFMVGGSEAGFARAQPILQQMGKAVIHAGPSGNGQAAKICNNMLLGISMIGVAEAFVLAERLGLSAAKLFEVSRQSSGQCWSLTNYCPVPGLVPSSPANRAYRAGFTAAMMAKDLRLAQDAAQSVDAPTPLGAQARQLYTLFTRGGRDALDFSAIIRMLAGDL